MNSSSRINSPSIDIEALFDGLSWDNETEAQSNLAALVSGIGLIHDTILNKLVIPESVDFSTLTRTLQDSDPLFKICKIVEEVSAIQMGELPRFKEIAADLRALRELISGIAKNASDEAGTTALSTAFQDYLDLLPKVHAHFVIMKEASLRWKGAVILKQQIEFVDRLLKQNDKIAGSEALLTWGNNFLTVISSGGKEDAKAPATEITALLTDINSQYLDLLQSEITRDVEYFKKTIVLTPATHAHALSGFSELIFRARKEAEKGATFRLTLDFEAVPIAAPASAQSGAPNPVQPIHLNRKFQTTYVDMAEIQNVVAGFVTPLQEEVDSGVFKDQDPASLKSWFTDSIIPWVQSDNVVMEES